MHAVLMGDTEIADKIRAARLPATQKYLGHYVSRLDNNSVAQRQRGKDYLTVQWVNIIMSNWSIQLVLNKLSPFCTIFQKK